MQQEGAREVDAVAEKRRVVDSAAPLRVHVHVHVHVRVHVRVHVECACRM